MNTLLSIGKTLIYKPIFNLLLVLYALTGNNLGLAIILLTILMRVLFFPFTKSQIESSEKLKKIRPQLDKIKKKYARNPQKAQQEQLKLYKKVGYNPLGCFIAFLIPLPIMIALYKSIRAFSDNDINDIYNFVRSLLDISNDIKINTDFLFWDLSKSYLPIAKDQGYFSIDSIAYLILSVLTGIAQFASTQLLTGMNNNSKKKKPKKNKKKSDELGMSEMMEEMSGTMRFTLPLMTSLAALRLPAAVSLYWGLQSTLTAGLKVLYTKIKRK